MCYTSPVVRGPGIGQSLRSSGVCWAIEGRTLDERTSLDSLHLQCGFKRRGYMTVPVDGAAGRHLTPPQEGQYSATCLSFSLAPYDL